MPVDAIFMRIRRALLLDQTAYEETRDDVAFTPIAVVIAVIVVLIAAIGAFLWGQIVLEDTPDGFFVDTVVLGTILLVLLWAIGILAIYLILSQVYREEIAPDALLRVVVLGHVPFAVSLLVLIPGIGFAFGVLSVAVMFFYTIYGLRAAYTNIDPFRIMVAVLTGFAVWLLILPLLTGPDDAFAPGIFVFEWSEDAVEDVIAICREVSDFFPTDQ